MTLALRGSGVLGLRVQGGVSLDPSPVTALSVPRDFFSVVYEVNLKRLFDTRPGFRV